MSTVTESVDVDVPVRTAYNQWTQFETFPEFMNGVERVTQLDDTHTHWVTKVGGVRREFDAVVTEQHPDERVAWTSTGGDIRQAGVVTFHRLDDTHSRVTIQMEWQPEGVTEKVGSAVGADDRQVKADARRFKEYIEQRGVESGGWRGDVPQPGTASGAWRGDMPRPSDMPGAGGMPRSGDAPQPGGWRGDASQPGR